MKIFKKCGCGRVHTELPVVAIHVEEGKFAGFYFNCPAPCFSTLFVPKEAA